MEDARTDRGTFGAGVVVAGLLFPLAFALVGFESVAFVSGLKRPAHAIAGSISVFLGALMLWQLAIEVPGLGRTGWTNVGRGGPGAQVLVALVLLALPVAALLHLGCARRATDAEPLRSVGTAALGAFGAVSCFFIVASSFVE